MAVRQIRLILLLTEPTAVGVSVVRKSDVSCWAGSNGEIEVEGEGGIRYL